MASVAVLGLGNNWLPFAPIPRHIAPTTVYVADSIVVKHCFDAMSRVIGWLRASPYHSSDAHQCYVRRYHCDELSRRHRVYASFGIHVVNIGGNMLVIRRWRHERCDTCRARCLKHFPPAMPLLLLVRHGRLASTPVGWRRRRRWLRLAVVG